MKFAVITAVLISLFAAGCAPQVPGETMLPGSLRRDARSQVLEQARNDAPDCRSQRVIGSEVIDLYGDAKVAAERWTVDQCGRRVDYIVSVPRDQRGGQRVLVRRAK